MIQRCTRQIFRTKSRYILNFNKMSTNEENSVYIGPLQQIITEKLQNQLTPTYLSIVNESYKHNVPAEAEYHFNVTIVSELFEGKSLLERHRLVNSTLSDELKTKIHALSIKAKTPTQWDFDTTNNTTPNCLGGHGK